jgi:hypothetical protein
MNKSLVYFIIIVALNACNYQSKSDFLIGTWNFKSLELDSNQIVVGGYDNLTLNSDSSFHYHIESISLNKKGRWFIDNRMLVLKYQSPDTVRKFEIKALSKFNLILLENQNKFVFSK